MLCQVNTHSVQVSMETNSIEIDLKLSIDKPKTVNSIYLKISNKISIENIKTCGSEGKYKCQQK